MVKLFFLASILAASTSSFAQETKILYHRNGQKALEGKWTYLNAGIPTVAALDVVVRHIKVERDDDDANEYQSVENISTDAASPYIKCEGLITAYYENGAKRAEISFADGVPNGPVKKYYSNGRVAAEGNFSNGMPDGEWKVFYKSGKLFYEGNYTPFNQHELHERWQLRVEGSWDKMEASLTGNDSLYGQDSEEALATTGARQQFGYFISKLLHSGKKDGVFRFYAENGKMLTEIIYKNDVRAGNWQTGNAGGYDLYRLNYANGRLVSAADGEEKPLGISAYVQRWRKAGAKIPVLEDAAPPPPQQDAKRKQ